MARKNIAVLDFGSSRVSVMIGERGVNKTFDIRGFGEKQYAGFMDGEFLEPENLMCDVQQALACAENNARCKITHLYVGVPAEFCVVAIKKARTEFKKKRRVTESDIENLFDEADDFSSSPNHTVINRAPVFYSLDDGRKIIEPKGKVSLSLAGTLSFILCEKSFIAKVQQILAPLHIAHIDFFSEQLCECLFLIEPEDRDRCAILVDSGYLTSSVSLVMGDGLINLNSFSLGGGHIVADLCDAFGLNVEQAEELKRQVSLNTQPQPEDFIQIKNGSGVVDIKVKEAQQVVLARVNQLARMIKKSLDGCSFEYPDYIPILLTGGGVSYIPGARDIITQVTERDTQIAKPQVPQLQEPERSSILGLLDLALKQNKTTVNLFFMKIFKKN